MKVKLNIANDANRFSQICSNSFREHIEARQGRYIVNAKSIMGLFSLDLIKPAEIYIETEDEYIKHRFKELVREWIVEE